MNEYPPEWPIIAERVKELAAWRCVRCLKHGQLQFEFGKEAA